MYVAGGINHIGPMRCLNHDFPAPALLGAVSSFSLCDEYANKHRPKRIRKSLKKLSLR